MPFVDFAAVTGVQVNMVRSLSKLYGKDFNEQIGKSLVTALVGTSLARMAASAVKTIPLLGSILGTATQAVLSGASTYAVGQVFIHHFDKGGSLSDFSPEDLKEKYKAEFERGKEFSIRAEKEQKSNMQSKEDIFNALEKLNSLKEKGIVSEEEYQAQKAKLLARI